MSDFAISLEQRRRLLRGDYGALKFKIKPYGCDPGARYVLAWSRASAVAVGEGDNVEVLRTPRAPVWWIMVRKVEDDPVKRPEARWLVRFDVTDLRDRDLWLSRSGNYQTSRSGAVDDLPVGRPHPGRGQQRGTPTSRR